MASAVGFADAVLDALPDATAVLDTAGTIVAVNHTWRMFAVDNGGDPDTTGVGVNYLSCAPAPPRAGCQDAAVVADGIRSVLDRAHRAQRAGIPLPVPGRRAMVPAAHQPARRTRHGRRRVPRQHHPPQDGRTRPRPRSRPRPADRAGEPDPVHREARRGPDPPPGRSAHADVGVLYLDLDGFKPVNDTYGHDAGDEVLLTTAHRLRDQVRPQDTVARLGGDEFAIVAPRITQTGLASLATRITDALAQPHLIHGDTVTVPASVGTHLADPGEAPDASYAAPTTRCTRSNGAAPQSLPTEDPEVSGPDSRPPRKG